MSAPSTSTWPLIALGDLVSFKTGKLDSNAALSDGQYPFFTCSAQTLRTDSFSFDCECVLLAGNNATGNFPIKYFSGRFDAYQRTYVIEPLPQANLDTRYLYHSLQLKLETMKSLSTGAATKFLTLPILRSIEIRRPPLSLQRKIVSILSAYDDLIENNSRRIKVLEEMAQRIYREWFVDFRYPRHENIPLSDSALGLIPQGWAVGTLGDVLSLLEAGSRPRGGIDPSERGVPSVGAENIIGIGQYDYRKEKFVSRSFFEQMRKGRIENGDVVLYKDGAYIGRVSLFRDGFPHAECAVNEHVFVLRTNDKHSQILLYLWLAHPDNRERVRALNANAAQPGLNQENLRALTLVVPPPELVRRFTKTVEPIIGLLFRLAMAVPRASNARDLLLPRLISGEINVADLDVPAPELAV